MFFITEWWLCNQLVPVHEPLPNLVLKGKGKSVDFCFHLASGEMKDENLEALHANMDFLITGLDVCHFFELKGNYTDSTVWNPGETGD